MKAKQWLSVTTIAAALAITGTAVAHGDKAQVSKQEQAGAAVNSNTAAQLGSDVNGNSAAQLGTDSSKATVPNDADAATDKSDTSPKGKALIEQTPSMDTTTPAPARTGSDARPGDMGPANTRGK